MEFEIKKCGILTMKRGKIVKSEGIKLPDGEVMKPVGQGGYTYLGIIELDKIKETEMKEKITKEYKQRQRLILKSKLNGRNKVTAINTWAVAIFRCVAGIIQWKASELKDLDRISRKTMTMYGGLHLKSDIDRLHVKRKEGGRGLIREEENSFGFYFVNSEENLIRGAMAAETINTRETTKSVQFKKLKAKELKEKWGEKRMHGQLIRETTEKVDKEKTWQWLSRGDLKGGTEALLCVAQEQAIRTNYMKYHIDRTSKSPLCR